MDLFTDGLTKHELKQAANYLAVIHATGVTPRGMHSGSNWSTTVMLGYRLQGLNWVLIPEALPLVEGHPLLATIEAMKAQGYRVDTSAMRRGRTISKGVPMMHNEDFRTATVDLDGTARQLDGPDGKWAYQKLGNPGQEVRA